jgi:N-methylhydantoinase A
MLDTPVVSRRDLLGKPMSGPLIIEEYDATCLVLPGYSARVDKNAIIDIRVEK